MTRDVDRDGDDEAFHGHGVFTCDSCETIVLRPRRDLDRMRCCEEPLREVTTATVEPALPTLETVSSDVFGLPKRAFEVWLHTNEMGVITVAQLAEELERDRSVATRYLNQLVDAGILVKTRRVRKDGGDVNVYYPISSTEMKRATTLGCYVWAQAAADFVGGVALESRTPEANDSQSAEERVPIFW